MTAAGAMSACLALTPGMALARLAARGRPVPLLPARHPASGHRLLLRCTPPPRRGAAAVAAASAPAAPSPASDKPPKAPGGGFLQEALESSQGKTACVCLKRGKDKLFKKDGNPIVYGGAVDRVEGRQPSHGDAVIVADHKRGAFAWGVFNPDSMYRVRIMQYAAEVERDPSVALDVPALVRRRVAEAAAARRAMRMPSEDVGAFRVVNSEGDRLSGVVADRYGDWVVVSSTAAWAERHREDVEAAILEHSGAGNVAWRGSAALLKQEGWPPGGAEGGGAGLGEGGEEGPGDEEVEGVAAEESGAGVEVEVVENGLKFIVGLSGQKTGFYVDQRDSRQYLRTLSAGLSVLDVCTYTGGFALSAAAGGASRVVGVDSSGPALELARRNAELNGLGGVCEFEKSDMADYLAAAVKGGEQWDVVVLDPPKLAPSRKSMRNATRKYVRLNSQAMKIVKPGGLLMSCSCSGAMTQTPGAFYGVLQQAAQQAGRHVSILRKAGAGPDHTYNLAYPEGLYLTNVLMVVH